MRAQDAKVAPLTLVTMAVYDDEIDGAAAVVNSAPAVWLQIACQQGREGSA